MKVISHKIESYIVQIYASDLKGRQTRWGDKICNRYGTSVRLLQLSCILSGSSHLNS